MMSGVHDEDLVSRSALKSESMILSYLMNEAQHLVFHDQSGPSLIKRKVPRSLRPLSNGLGTSSEATTRRDKTKKKYLSQDKDGKDKKKKSKKDKKEKSDRSHRSSRSASSRSTSDMSDFTPLPGSPVTYLLQEFRKFSPDGTSPRTFPSLKMTGVFSEWTKEQMEAYDKDAIAAIRNRNIELLRSWHEGGRTLQAANNFGESLLHTACRRGFLEVVKFLVDECGHDLWIRDDTGRTPLHDACWTTEPCPDLVDYIVSKECDMLLVCDKRGHTPLDYARKDHWDFWIMYLKQLDLKAMLPKRDIFYTSAIGSTPACQNLIIVENLETLLHELNLGASEKEPKRQSSKHAFRIVEDEAGEKSDNSNGSKKSGFFSRLGRRRRSISTDSASAA